jgi:hypothetical protein
VVEIMGIKPPSQDARKWLLGLLDASLVRNDVAEALHSWLDHKVSAEKLLTEYRQASGALD